MVSRNHLTSVISLALALAVILPGGQCRAEKDNFMAVPGLMVDQENTAGSYKTLAGVPPIKYIRKTIPKAKVPYVQGAYYDALVPDTIDLADRARLVVNTFTQLACPQAEYELYIYPRFNLDPPRVSLGSGSGLCWPKEMEALPLMRIMSGSKQGLEVDKAWAEDILHSLGPDGLWYLGITGRPWDKSGFDIAPTGDQIGADADQYCYIALNGRLLAAIGVYYKITGDKIWLEAGNKLVDGMNRVATRDGDKAYFKNSCYYPNGLPPAGEGQQNFGWNATGLCHYYRISGYKPALDLAKALVNGYRANFSPNGEWDGHFHVNTLWIHALAEYAYAAHDMETGRLAQKAYEYGKSNKVKGSLPSVGFFPTGDLAMEPCNVGDMTAIALKLTLAGVADNWDDVDRYVRNGLVESQWTRPDQISDFISAIKDGRAVGNPVWTPSGTKKQPIEYYDSTDRIPERLVGFFSTGTLPNDMHLNDWDDICCTDNCSRALYYAWENILTYDKGTVNINLLMNRASEWADVDSYIPYKGRVDVKIKKSCNLRVRMNDWIDKNKVRCTVAGKARDFKYEGKYVKVGPVKPGQVVVLSFPIYEHTEKLTTAGHTYTVVFKGNDAVEMTPRGPAVPLYQRSHYRQEQPRYVKAKRFISSQVIKY